MSTTALCIIGGAVFGLVIAFINSRVSKAGLKSESPQKAMTGNLIRILLDAAALGITFLVCKKADLPLAPALVSVAIALSVGGALMLIATVKAFQKSMDADAENKQAQIPSAKDDSNED